MVFFLDFIRKTAVQNFPFANVTVNKSGQLRTRDLSSRGRRNIRRRYPNPENENLDLTIQWRCHKFFKGQAPTAHPQRDRGRSPDSGKKFQVEKFAQKNEKLR